MQERRVRTINQTVKFFKEKDPECPIGYSTVKKAVEDGYIKSILSGNRNLIVLEDAYQFFYGVPLNN